MSMQQPCRSLLMRCLLWLMLCAVGASGTNAAEHDPGLSTEAIINLSSTDAWELFTSEAGLKSLGYSQARIDLQLGGQLRASGAAALNSLNDEIISIDPGHMLSFKPAGNAANNQWTVLYFIAMGKDMTQLRWLEFFPEEQRAPVIHQQQQVRQLFDQLIRRYAPECEVCKRERALDGK
jgi:hypothetical protein